MNIVYSPNGGMAQLYVRGAGDWTDSPTAQDIELVAGALFIEAVGGVATDPTGAVVRYPRIGPPPAYSGLCPVLLPKLNAAFGPGLDNGALGDPPAIFVRVNSPRPLPPPFRVMNVTEQELSIGMLSSLDAEFLQNGVHLSDNLNLVKRTGAWMLADLSND